MFLPALSFRRQGRGPFPARLALLTFLITVTLFISGQILPATETNQIPALTNNPNSHPASIPSTEKGRQLFLLNCAHCHAPDATGDEGPDLHGLRKSDAKIFALIKNGVKGEMPKFSAKLSAADIQALIALIRSFNE
jgi:mono/diheme cytochrome c family protein